MRPSIAAIILTFNEEVNLEKCLKSIDELVDEIFIVDSYSADKTLEIAEKYGAKIVQHSFKNQADQFNWALDNLDIKSEWILRLDADEYLTEELKKEISYEIRNQYENTKLQKDVNGYYIKRRVYFIGRWIKHGGYYPVWFLRLWRKNKARMEDREMDEHAILLEGRAERLKNDFVDDNKKPLEDWISKHNDYSSREARARLKELITNNQQPATKWKRFYLKLPLFGRAFLYFIYRYIFRLGFLDGKEGLIFHFLQGCWHQFLIDAKIYERRHQKFLE